MDGGRGRGRPFNYVTTGVAASEVEVDTATGDFGIRRSDVLMDLGRSINPAVDIGQIEGAFVQGTGWLTLEQVVMGSAEFPWVPRGVVRTIGPGNYKIPSADDIPRDFRVHLLRDSANPRAVHSSRAVGEPPFFLGSSVFFAIRRALGVAGEAHVEAPLTTPKIYDTFQQVLQRVYEKPL